MLREARAMGAIQLGFSAGEPLVRRDLEELVAEGSALGYYTNLIASGIGMDEARLARLKTAGLDHIQISFQPAHGALNNFLGGGADTFEKKKAIARSKDQAAAVVNASTTMAAVVAKPTCWPAMPAPPTRSATNRHTIT